MFTSRKFIVCFLVGCIAAAGAVQAERLEPVLRARDLTGTVTVQRAGADRFVPVEDGRTYPYGSRFRASAESSVRLAMSESSSVRVLANTEMVFTEGSRNANIKTVQLVRGEVEAYLGQNFQDAGNVLNVVAGSTVTQALGTRYRVASRYEQDLQIVVIRVLAGLVRVIGENFEVAELGTDDWLSLLSPPDESFLRLKNMRGQFDITVKDEDLSSKQLPTEEGSVLKIWQRIVPETGERVINAVFSDPDGREIENISLIYGPGEFADFLADVRDEDDEFPWDQDDRPVARPERPDPREKRNPMPPDDFMDELVDRTLEDLAPGFGTEPPPPPPPAPEPPRPPVRPTPTPRGRQ